MEYKLSIQSEDYTFIKEAIKLRTLAILENMDMEVDAQIIQATQPAEAFGPCSFASAPAKEEGKPISYTVNVAPQKKPHWTQTPAGKKKMAARKRKGQK